MLWCANINVSSMSTKKIEGVVPDLPKEKLMQDWLLEAQSRGKELDNKIVQPVLGEEVMRRAVVLLK